MLSLKKPRHWWRMAGTSKEVIEGVTLGVKSNTFCRVMQGILTSASPWGMVKAPKFSVRRSNRLSILPRDRKSIAAYSACYAAGVFIGRLTQIGRNISDFQHPRGLAASQRAGESSLFSGLFAFNPQILCEVMPCLN